MRSRGRVFPVMLILATIAVVASAADRSLKQIAEIVAGIQRADYEDDRPALKRLRADLAPFAEHAENDALAARVRYWQGFALWRRAINGFNDHADAAELQQDLKLALDDFSEASVKDPAFTDARIASLSCLGFLAFSVSQQEPASPRIQELVAQARQLRKDAEAAAPENPRLPWVMGPMIWNTPAERGGGQAKAIEGYEKALEVVRKHQSAVGPLEPSWGEPELLMSLAWSNLNRTSPDLNAADLQARAALKLVPHWHYVRDILLPQIQEAQKKQKPKTPV